MNNNDQDISNEISLLKNKVFQRIVINLDHEETHGFFRKMDEIVVKTKEKTITMKPDDFLFILENCLEKK